MGTLRLAYTLATVYETLPALVDALTAEHPEVKVRPREVFAEDIARMLDDGRIDLALAPQVDLPAGGDQRLVRREPFVAAVAESHPLAAAQDIPLATLADETIELWPASMSPGYHDAVVDACRDAGFEPRLDEQGAGSAVWGTIARDQGAGLVVASMRSQLPRGPHPGTARAADALPGHRPRLAERRTEARGTGTGCDGPPIGATVRPWTRLRRWRICSMRPHSTTTDSRRPHRRTTGGTGMPRTSTPASTTARPRKPRPMPTSTWPASESGSADDRLVHVAVTNG
jgi:hypothetical protein